MGRRGGKQGGRGRKGRRTAGMMRQARERMESLLAQAKERALVGDLAYARRYVELARKLGTRYNVRLRPEEKRWICKECNAFLVPGLNARVRTRGRTVITCLSCGSVARYRLSRRVASGADGRARVQEDSSHEAPEVLEDSDEGGEGK